MHRLFALASSLTLIPVQADDAAIRKTLGERYPGIVIQAVTPTPLARVGGLDWRQPVYTDDTGAIPANRSL